MVVDWQEALNQVGGDKDFLKEVLGDLKEEARTAVDSIRAGISESNFNEIMKAAHRIKGSASYLGCQAVRDTACSIQMLSHDALDPNANHAEYMKSIQANFEIFVTSVNDLDAEVSRWFSVN